MGEGFQFFVFGSLAELSLFTGVRNNQDDSGGSLWKRLPSPMLGWVVAKT